MSGAAGLRVVVVDAGGANLGSVCYALERLGVQPQVVADAAGLQAADRVILPGVGAAPEAMRRLHAQGMVEPLRTLQSPLLGICLGMQLLYERSEEGDVACLGLLPGTVRRLQPAPGIRIPHMGWNRVNPVTEHPVWAGIAPGSWFYFVHSYYAKPAQPANVAATTDYPAPFASALAHGKLFAVQFHPEKSQAAGLRLLANFLDWNPAG